jgi:tRNA 2-thiouridine synthesizing protein A
MENEPEALDLTGLKCPLPALFARRHLMRAAAGTTVLVVSDDPMAPIDIAHMCRNEGFEVLEVRRENDVARMMLRKP